MSRLSFSSLFLMESDEIAPPAEDKRRLIRAWAMRRVTKQWTQTYLLTHCLISDEIVCKDAVDGFSVRAFFDKPVGVSGLVTQLESLGYVEMNAAGRAHPTSPLTTGLTHTIRRSAAGDKFVDRVNSDPRLVRALTLLPMSETGFLDVLAGE